MSTFDWTVLMIYVLNYYAWWLNVTDCHFTDPLGETLHAIFFHFHSVTGRPTCVAVDVGLCAGKSVRLEMCRHVLSSLAPTGLAGVSIVLDHLAVVPSSWPVWRHSRVGRVVRRWTQLSTRSTAINASLICPSDLWCDKDCWDAKC